MNYCLNFLNYFLNFLNNFDTLSAATDKKLCDATLPLLAQNKLLASDDDIAMASKFGVNDAHYNLSDVGVFQRLSGAASTSGRDHIAIYNGG